MASSSSAKSPPQYSPEITEGSSSTSQNPPEYHPPAAQQPQPQKVGKYAKIKKIGLDFFTVGGMRYQPPARNIPVFQKVVMPAPGYDEEQVVPFDGASMFPNETVIYLDEHRDMVVSTDYDAKIIRPLPIYYIEINFKTLPGYSKGADSERQALPLILHRGHDKTGPIYGFADQIERHATGTLNNHVYNPSAPFATTAIKIDAHLTKARCNFEFLTADPSDPSVQTMQKFLWKQCEGDEQVVALSKTRAIDAHDWSWIERKNKRGMKLFHEASGESMAVFVAGKKHSKMNPVRIAAKVRWLESERWTEELKLAAFLALMTYGEKSRRVGTGGAL